MNKKLLRVYYLLPNFIKSLLTTFLLWRQRNLRYGTYYKQYLIRFTKNWNKSEEQLTFYTNKQLVKILSEAYYCTLFYRIHFRGILSNETIASMKSNPESALPLLKKLPFSDKQILNQSGDDAYNNMRNTTHVNYTSGSSGSPSAIPYDDESFQIGFALWRRFHTNIGLPNRFRSVRLSGKLVVSPSTKKAPFWVYNAFDKQLFMSTYHLTETNLRAYVQKLNQFKPQFIDAYPSAIYILAEYINRHNLELLFQPFAIATTAETLFDSQRTAIEKAFGCKVYNQYSSSEGGPFITECTAGKLHLNTDSAIFEFLVNDSVVNKGSGMAELVVTSFRQWKFPLIRYRSGDFVRFDENAFKYQACSCGCNMPFVLEILGRQDDILFTKEKGWVGRLDTAYKALYGIKASSIIQKEIDHVQVLVVPDNGYNEEVKNELLSNLKDRLGKEITFEVKMVDSIPQGANGKIKAVHRLFEV